MLKALRHFEGQCGDKKKEEEKKKKKEKANDIMRGMFGSFWKEDKVDCPPCLYISRTKNGFFGLKDGVHPREYCDIKLNVLFEWPDRKVAVIGEVQFLLDAMLEAKLRCHDLYSIARQKPMIEGTLARIKQDTVKQKLLLAGGKQKGCSLLIFEHAQGHLQTDQDDLMLIGSQLHDYTKVTIAKLGQALVRSCDDCPKLVAQMRKVCTRYPDADDLLKEVASLVGYDGEEEEKKTELPIDDARAVLDGDKLLDLTVAKKTKEAARDDVTKAGKDGDDDTEITGVKRVKSQDDAGSALAAMKDKEEQRDEEEDNIDFADGAHVTEVDVAKEATLGEGGDEARLIETDHGDDGGQADGDH